MTGSAPMGAGFLAPELEETVERMELEDQADAVDWVNYGACPVCLAQGGKPCVALSGRVAGGRPDGVRTPLPRAHALRKRRAGR